ncbi:actin-related protein 2/3 complex subunit 1A-like [Actinia tenebrosa]|uniref:Actin-related protein 2/3 complex subunit n=1 Tax=Actinia tenebrosa TaxID=6105 RepID=A0A6P8HNC4_ACTTE|nr:actin-related protein 2/3 complex subunit 1A-like [Actinia tenebrosa]
MSGKEVHELTITPITCFAFNKARNQLAICPNDNTVHIYKKSGNKWTADVVLNEHGQRVTDMDWGQESNRLVTCGADRNAYVWTLNDGQWKPMLVILRINRAATCVRWSPKEDKFAVGSGARLISVCYFEKDNDWWVSKHIKKPIRSTILSIDWHPNNLLLASGSSDFKARIFSAFIKDVDGKTNCDTEWGKKAAFGNCLAEFSTGSGGWVHGVSFSASGHKLAWVGHDSSISVVNADHDNKVVTVHTNFLPLRQCLWITEHSIVAAGHNNLPYLFTHDDNDKLTFIEKMDAPKKKEDTGTMSAMAKFRTLDKKGQGADESSSSSSNTTHQNAINKLELYSGTKDGATKFVTSGIDGRLVIWDIKTLVSSISGLKIA